MHDGDAQRLAETMSALAVTLAAEHNQQGTLKAIVAAAVTTVPGARWAGISLIAGREITATTSTDDIVRDIDQMQHDLDEGPCLTAIREHHTVLSNDLATESRWPRFATKAAERGVQSMLSFRLFVDAANLGALNLYGAAAGVFTTDSQIVGALFAQHAAVALASSTRDDQLTDAIATRDVIGQAKGILMHRNRITGQQAFTLLVHASQHTQIKLVDIARWTVEEHESTLPEPPDSVR
jgi:GAF domain-containing protein